MSPFLICRVCLIGNVKMFSIADDKLLQIFEKLSNCKVNSGDGMPTMVCYICVSQLRRCHRFFDLVNKSTRTLTYLLHNGVEVLPSNVTALNLGATHHLTVEALPEIYLVESSNHEITAESGNEQVFVKEEIQEDKYSIDIDESNLDIFEQHDREENTNSIYLTDKFIDCNASNSHQVKLEVVVVKEEIDDDNNLIDVSDYCDVDVNCESMKQPENNKPNSCEKDLYYDCDKCNKRYISKVNLIKHLKTHSGGNPYSCDSCNKSFFTVASLKRHMLMHNAEKEFPCVKCHKAFKRIGDLKRHMRTHTEERSFVCNLCNKSFHRGECLKQHMRIHTGEKPFVCNICKKAFNAVANLKTHIHTHTGEKPYPCETCKKAFKSFAYLKKHALLHTYLP